MGNKRSLGQYYTINNPFKLDVFRSWLQLIPDLENQIILEPFAGGNNIPEMIIQDNILTDNKWSCYDIEPGDNACPQFKIRKRDTIKNYPKGYKIAITNPPYLARVSASRRHLDYPKTKYDDVYKLCLDTMLNNTDYVAAIVPETFITANELTERLWAVISLTDVMFNDTDCPVCLALFVPEKTETFDIYQMNKKLGSYKELKNEEVKSSVDHDWKFNDPEGEIGIWCIDNTKEASIHFGKGELIDPASIKISSRAFTRVSGLDENINLDEFIRKCNEILSSYRQKTSDVFLSSFKGLRKDGMYRRRLDFKVARDIMNSTLEALQ